MNNPLRVLIAEDSEDDALLLVQELKNAGFDPIFRRIETAGEMKAVLNAQTWDIVIADYTMPHFSGLAALKMVKESGLDLPFIIVSGTIGEDPAVGAMKAGAHDYIMKNNLPRLIPTIERELRDALTRQERKKAEEALKDSEEKYRTLVDHSLQGIVVAQGPSPRLLFVNPAMSRILGYTTDELLSLSSKKLENLVHPEDREFFFKSFRDRLEGKEVPQNYEVRGIRKDGSVCWLAISGNRIEYKGKPAVQAAFIDITERKQAEKAFKDSERLSWAVLETAPSLIVLTDADGHIFLFNRACEELTGYKREEVIGKTIVDLFLPPEWIPIVQKRFADPYAPVVRVPHENPWRTKSGEERLIEWRCTVLPSPVDGSPHILGTGIDISERKRAEEALRESEERYRSLFDGMPIGLYRTNSEGEILDANPALVEMLGYPDWESLSKVKAVGTDVDPEERKKWVTLMEQKGIVHSFQRQLRRRDASIIWVEENARVFRDAESEGLYHYEGSFQDITERKGVEEALRENEERFRLAAESSTDLIYEWDTKEHIDWFGKIDELLGYAPNEFPRTFEAWADSVHPNDRDRVMAAVKNHLEKSVPYDIECRVRKKDGTYNYWWARGTAVRDEKGSPYRWVGAVTDITERKRAQENLKQSEENAKQLAQENAIMAEIGRIISSTLNIDEIYESFSKEAEKLVSFDRIVINIIDIEKSTVKNAYITGERVRDRNVEEIYPLKGSGNEEMVRTKSTLLIQTEDFNEYKDRFPMLRSTFQAGFRSIMNVPLFSKGKIIGGLLLRSRKPYAYTDKDVRLAERIGSQIAGAIENAQLYTERLRAEEEKAALQEQLRQSQKMEAIGRLAGGVAHDFNNLLTVIKGNSELSLMDVKEDDPLRENLEGILRASGRASGLIRQLLAFSRRQVMEMRVLDLNTVLEDLDKMLRRIIGEDIKLVILPSKDLQRIKADAGQIEQVILNLAVNSRDAMLSGGRLTIETANAELDEEYARRHVAVIPGRYVMLSVSDTGGGMTPEVRDKVFEPFFTTKESSKGTGLGLSTVYGIVKQSGGNIWVYSEPGKGTTFKIYLPRVDEPLGEVVREKVAEGGLPRGSETILIVEDDEDVREVAVRILKMQGYRVLETSQGSDALHHGEHEAGPIHLMVTDVVMPGMNGPELAKRLSPLRPEMKVLYISGYTDNAIVHHGVLEKGVNYIQKPFTVEGLVRKVREVLDQ